MQSIDQEGKTVEEALEKALAALDKTQDDVDYEILDEGSKGVLGVGARPILIRVRAKDTLEITNLKTLMSTFLTELDVNFSDLDAQLNKNDIVKINMNTEDAAILIGKHGQTLDAIQYIFNQVLHDTKYKLMVDISGYKEKHNLKLVETVKKIASTVIHSGRRITLKPMTAFERRIVHEAVKEFPELSTKSIGVEPDRRVVISLLNAPEYEPAAERPRYTNNRSNGGGYQNRGNSYQPREGGYQPRDNGNSEGQPNRGNSYQPREGGYQPRDNSGSGGGYQNRGNSYQPREGGYQPRDNSGSGGG
ncbi:KH domain-containing protein, partial [bacterium]